ncbi:hypothetical protein [Algibacter sp. Ld11]|uniref:hypothetical protein n=1 Tax=Algibacter sp. Ld11 TaxID=649150 RepID=UPI00386BF5E6
MNTIQKKINLLQNSWNQIAALGAWLGTIAGAILIPLPEWGDSDQYSSQIKFILFISTVIAGFILILTYYFKKKRTWLIISISLLFSLICSYCLYSENIDKRTMKYYNSTIVIGNKLKEPNKLESKMKILNIDKSELLKAVGGNASKIWTDQSIKTNKNYLIFLLAFNYCLFAIFLVSFTNMIKLYTSINE